MSRLSGSTDLVNVGAGTGAYEPLDRAVVAVEPSMTMILQRPARAAPVVRATAERLPFKDGAFGGGGRTPTCDLRFGSPSRLSAGLTARMRAWPAWMETGNPGSGIAEMLHCSLGTPWIWGTG